MSKNKTVARCVLRCRDRTARQQARGDFFLLHTTSCSVLGVLIAFNVLLSSLHFEPSHINQSIKTILGLFNRSTTLLLSNGIENVKRTIIPTTCSAANRQDYRTLERKEAGTGQEGLQSSYAIKTKVLPNPATGARTSQFAK